MNNLQDIYHLIIWFYTYTKISCIKHVNIKLPEVQTSTIVPFIPEYYLHWFYLYRVWQFYFITEQGVFICTHSVVFYVSRLGTANHSPTQPPNPYSNFWCLKIYFYQCQIYRKVRVFCVRVYFINILKIVILLSRHIVLLSVCLDKGGFTVL